MTGYPVAASRHSVDWGLLDAAERSWDDPSVDADPQPPRSSGTTTRAPPQLGKRAIARILGRVPTAVGGVLRQSLMESSDVPRSPGSSSRCRLCGSPLNPLFQLTVLSRHQVRYYQCPSCGLAQTEEPTWLDEAYSTPLAAIDTGALARNLDARRIVAAFLHLAGAGGEPCLDWAGGHGVFVRLMRDIGFNFYWQDQYAENHFARGFEWHASLGVPFACTAFEVLEHFALPVEGFERLAAYGAQYIVTSTELYAGSTPDPGWFYLAPESGQHVAFYLPETLQRLGRQFGYPHVVAGARYQVFARRPFPAWWWHLALRRNWFVYRWAGRARRSLTDSDSSMLRQRLGQAEPAGAPPKGPDPTA